VRMAEELEINKIRIADVQDAVNEELSEAEQEMVTGGGSYGSDGSDGG
jgi:hypothetical protein